MCSVSLFGTAYEAHTSFGSMLGILALEGRQRWLEVNTIPNQRWLEVNTYPDKLLGSSKYCNPVQDTVTGSCMGDMLEWVVWAPLCWPIHHQLFMEPWKGAGTHINATLSGLPGFSL